MPSRSKVSIKVAIGTPQTEGHMMSAPVQMTLEKSFANSAEASRAVSLFLGEAISLACQWDAAALNTPAPGDTTP